MRRFKPGESVPRSGIYRAYHKSHRLMHEATLLNGELFPRCKHCSNVRFELIRWLHNADVLPFRSGEILIEYRDKIRRTG
jgi:hypothetical protein